MLEYGLFQFTRHRAPRECTDKAFRTGIRCGNGGITQGDDAAIRGGHILPVHVIDTANEQGTEAGIQHEVCFRTLIGCCMLVVLADDDIRV